MQQGMLFHWLNAPHSGVDIQQLVVHLPEPVDGGRMESAWTWLLQRHDILRTKFVWEQVSEPRQEILSDVRLPFSVEDLRSFAVVEQDTRLKEFLDADRVEGFNLGQAPFMRVKLFQRGDASFVLVWTFHHALLDGRCYPILLREVFDVYEEPGIGALNRRPAPSLFRRYVEWIYEQDFVRSEPFWRKLLSGFSAPTPLVVDRINSEVGGVQQGEVWEQIDSTTTARLRVVASQYDVTLNTLFMGAWSVLLHRYSGETDIVFGATRACRKSSIAGAEEGLGLFINTVPVRAQVTPDDQVVRVVQSLRQQWLNIRPHEHSPLTKVKVASQVPSGQSLFDSLVVFERQRLDQTMAGYGGAWGGRRVELHELTNFPLTLAAYDGETLSFKLEFNRSRIDEATADRLVGHLRRLLEGLAAQPECRVRELPMLTDRERSELLYTFNDSVDESIAYESTLHGLFEAQVDLRPESIAVSCNGRSITYRELNQRANQLACRLRKLGVGRNVLVGLFLERSVEMVVGLLGVLKAGGAYVPIDPEYPADRVAFMVENAAAPVLLVQGQLTSKLPPYRGIVLSLDEDWRLIGQEAMTNQSSAVDPGDLAYVIYTSGSTGQPKGAMNGHRAICNRLLWMQNQYGMTPDDSVLQKTPFSFDVSVWEFFWPLTVGARLVMAKPGGHRDPVYLLDVIEKERITIMHFVPSMLAAFLTVAGLDRCRSLRHVICSGEALSFNLQESFYASMSAQLHNLYGPTEAAIDVSHWTCRRHDERRIVPIGRPVANTQIYVLDPSLQPVPIGVGGELYIGGVQVGRGYHNRPELTAERFIPDHLGRRAGGRLYKTGDLARFLPGGEIEYLGRADFQVKIRGFRIELGEIESVLCRHPAVREAVVVAREDVPGIKTLAAYLVTASPTPEISELREHLKKTVPDYMVPAAFVVLDQLPLTSNGKIDRKALPSPEYRAPERVDRYVAPRTPTEQRLVSIWSKVLRLERVGVQDNFFELGGDSILSIQAMAAARQDGLMLTTKQMFTYQTIAELARQIDDKEIIPLSQDVSEGNVPLTPIQRWFFEQNLDESHYYNQALLLDVAEPLDREILAQGLEAVSLHHDTLRFRYVHDTTGWRQFYAVGAQTSVLQWVNVADLDETARSHMIESMIVSAHESLDLEQGPLWRVLYFDGGPDRLGQLLIVIHHLAVDGVSWRPIVEDLEMAYLQSKAGQPVRLSPKTTSFKAWSRELRAFAASDAVQAELAYWKAVTTVPVQPSAVEEPHRGGVTAENKEGTAKTILVSLSAMETEALLYTVPGIYNTQINDVLLTALARAWQQVTGSSGLFTNLEGHGREQLITDLDLSRTVGWFTSLFPVRLELPVNEEEWDPGQALKSIKEQLRRVPRRGIGYGLLRYLRDGSDLAAMPEPNMVFNYFGQFDQVLSGSKLFRFSSRSTGPWHSPKQQRRHALEINGMVKGGRLELSWTYCPALHSANRIERLTSEFLDALKQLISHCQLPGVRGRTPSDYPLAQLDQPSVDRLVAGRMDIEDIYRLSPIQSLFFSVNPGSHSTDFDQWQCTLRGPMDLAAFQRAWHETIHRHTVLRSSIHGEGLNESVQVVHRHVELPWIIEDWRGVSAEDQSTQWSTFLKRDKEQPLTLTEAPVMRFALFQLADESWRFVWSVSALLLDGWSWPIVFRDVSKLYASFCDDHRIVLDPVRPYRDYMEWLNKSSSKDAQVYWQRQLKGFRIPTSLRSEAPDGFDGEGDRYPEHVTTFSTQLTADLHGLARRRQVTLSTLVQAAWALLLMRQSGGTDVVFGAAFSGRPVELRDAAGIVGPFVNNIPIRVQADACWSLDEFLKQLQSHVLEVGPYQFMPLLDIQECSELPWQYRPFESLVVFQNYLVDEAARRFGADIEVEDFKGPIHTNYPVLLLAEPGPTLRLTLIRDRQRIAKAAVERWGSDLALIMMNMPQSLDRSIGELRDKLSEPSPRGVRSHKPMFSTSQQVVPPQTDLESSIALVWQKIFGLDRVSVEDNLFDLGGHSLLLITMHSRLRMALKRDFPLVTLFTHPTIRSLAGYFEEGGDAAHQSGVQWRHRAQQKKAAMKYMRSKWGKKV